MQNLSWCGSVVVASAVTLCLVSLGAAWQPETAQPPARQPAAPRRAQPEIPNLERSMKQMDRGLKQLREQIGEVSKLDENLRLIGEAQRGCIYAKSVKPDHALREARTEADRARILAEYRAGLIVVMRKLLDAEEAIAAGEPEAAIAALDEVDRLREKVHQALGVKEH